MRKMIQSLLAVAATAVVGSAASAAVVYQETFENPSPSPAWTGFSNTGSVLENYNAGGLNGPSVAGSYGSYVMIPVLFPNVAGEYVGTQGGSVSVNIPNGTSFTVSFDAMGYEISGGPSRVYGANIVSLFRYGVNGGPEVNYMGPGGAATPWTTLTNNWEWKQMLGTHTNTSGGTITSFTPLIYVYDTPTSTWGSFAFDNYKVEVVPEPSSAMLLAVGAAGLLARRRQSR